MIEHFFQCPYCWKSVSMLLDSSIDNQAYIEDCEVCCNPIKLTVQFRCAEIISFQVENIGQ